MRAPRRPLFDKTESLENAPRKLIDWQSRPASVLSATAAEREAADVGLVASRPGGLSCRARRGMGDGDWDWDGGAGSGAGVYTLM